MKIDRINYWPWRCNVLNFCFKSDKKFNKFLDQTVVLLVILKFSTNFDSRIRFFFGFFLRQDISLTGFLKIVSIGKFELKFHQVAGDTMLIENSPVYSGKVTTICSCFWFQTENMSYLKVGLQLKLRYYPKNEALEVFSLHSQISVQYWIRKFWKIDVCDTSIPAGNYMFKVNNRNIKTRLEICSDLTVKTPERRQWHRSSIFIVNFEHISHLVLVTL